MAMNAAKDPKGYYVALGVSEDASLDEIKSAFRQKAKRLHPDHNPSPIAAKQFHRLRDAYETLSDPLRRAAYDRGWRTVHGGMGSGGMGNGAQSEARAKQEPPKQEAPKQETPKKEPPKQEPPKQEPPKADKPAPEPPRTTPAADQPATCQCGKITAQPRYIIFDMLMGQVTKLNRKGLAGVYCRTCADKAAIKASLMTWLAGWWAWPNGPKETIKAIISNMRGGRRPPERNAKLLIKQARAFKARNDMQLARACAEQALPFASNAAVRREIDALLSSLSSFPAREIKDRWANPGLAPFVQMAPLIVVAVGLSMAATLSAPMSLTDYVKALLAPPEQHNDVVHDAAAPSTDIKSGRVYAVKVDLLPLRTGPSTTFRISTTIKLGTIVLVTEQDATGHWARITLNDGTTGFVETGSLTPDVNVDALTTLGGFGSEKPQAPETPTPQP
ncbi:MAG: DnaJ domain-containing protein [Rhodospirillaceae bacterium]|nr:DnaJ domain-containing protein [Rhodospirillaceae bacterium]